MRPPCFQQAGAPRLRCHPSLLSCAHRMAAEDAASAAALQLMRRLPPEQVVNNLGTVLNARPDLTEELLSRVDQPLQVATDEVSGRDFLLCDYNRDADSYRHAPGAGAARIAQRIAHAGCWLRCGAEARR